MQNIKGRSRKIYVKFSGVFVFDLEISNGCNIHVLPKFQGWSFLNFQGWSFVLPEISRGTEKNKNNSRGFFKKVCHQPPLPVWFFLLK